MPRLDAKAPCPACGGKTKVHSIGRRLVKGKKVRHRRCLSCQKRFRTHSDPAPPEEFVCWEAA